MTPVEPAVVAIKQPEQTISKNTLGCAPMSIVLYRLRNGDAAKTRSSAMRRWQYWTHKPQKMIGIYRRFRY